jgi:hypothetical protein
MVVYLINVGVNLFFSGPDELGAASSVAFYVQSTLGLPVQVLLALGLVGLYARQSDATGTIGFIGFLMAFVGTFFAPGLLWATLLADLGWTLFGVSSLRARVYPLVAAILLVIGAVFSGIASFLVGSPGSILMDEGAGAASVFNAVLYVGVGAKLVLYAAIAWLGFTLLANRSQAARQPGPAN